MIKSKFKEGAVTLSLKDPLANMQTKTNMAVFINTWVRSGNELVTRDPNDMGPAANLTRSQVLAAGFRKYGDGVDNMRVCLSYAYTGLMAMAYSNIGKPSPPPLIIDLVPAHTQTEFHKKVWECSYRCKQHGRCGTHHSACIRSIRSCFYRRVG